MSTTTETKITIFTQTGCEPCIMLKDWLNKNNIQFEEKNITEDPIARKKFDELGLFFTPISYIKYNNQKHTVPGANIENYQKILSI